MICSICSSDWWVVATSSCCVVGDNSLVASVVGSSFCVVCRAGWEVMDSVVTIVLGSVVIVVAIDVVCSVVVVGIV